MSKDERPLGDVEETRNWGDEEKLRRYLLGLSSPEESDEVERAMLVEDLGSILDVIEDELVEDYITGELSNFERSHFEKQVLFKRGLIQKIRVSAVLLGKPDAVKSLGPGASDPRPKSKPVVVLTQSLGEPPSKRDTQPASFDQSYVERLRGGDPSILEDFVNCFNALLEQKISSRIESRQVVDDVRQETFARVLRVLSNPSTQIRPEQLGAFVNTVCNHVLIDYYRSSLRSATLNEEGYKVLPATGAGVLDQIVQHGRMEGEHQEAPQQLTPKDRLTLRKIFIEDRNEEEVCGELGVDREYLRQVLQRARKAFERAFPDVGKRRA